MELLSFASFFGYIFTHRWTLYILICLILLCISESTRKVVLLSLVSAVGFWLLWIFLLTLRSYDTCNAIRNFSKHFWFEISFASGLIWTYFPTLSSWIRFVVAAPIAWVAVVIFDAIYNFLDNLILTPLMNWIYSPAANIWQIVGNVINVAIFIVVCLFIVRRYHRAVAIFCGIFIIIVEYMMLMSQYHECTISPIIMWPNDQLTWWQWLSFGISIVEVVFFACAAPSFKGDELFDD